MFKNLKLRHWKTIGLHPSIAEMRLNSLVTRWWQTSIVNKEQPSFPRITHQYMYELCKSEGWNLLSSKWRQRLNICLNWSHLNGQWGAHSPLLLSELFWRHSDGFWTVERKHSLWDCQKWFEESNETIKTLCWTLWHQLICMCVFCINIICSTQLGQWVFFGPHFCPGSLKASNGYWLWQNIKAFC